MCSQCTGKVSVILLQKFLYPFIISTSAHYQIILTFWFTETGQDCIRYPVSIQVFSLVYGSFILLFGKLFYDSVIKAGRRHRAKQTKLQQEAAKKVAAIEQVDMNGNKIKAE